MGNNLKRTPTDELEARAAEIDERLRRLEHTLTTDDAEEHARAWALGIVGPTQHAANFAAIASGGRDRHPDAVAEVVLAYVAESGPFKEWLARRCAETAAAAGARPRAEHERELAKLRDEAEAIRRELARRDVEQRRAALEAELASLA